MASLEFSADLQPVTERAALTQRLDAERAAVLAQASDLSLDEFHARPLKTTDLSIGRIVKHLAYAEDRWFQHYLLGLEMPEPWRPISDAEMHEWSFHSADENTQKNVLDLYTHACGRSRAVTEACPTMDTVGVHPFRGQKPVNLRWLLAHMIDETAHHSGHIDLIRDALGRPPVR